jgi:hypothetical protein
LRFCRQMYAMKVDNAEYALLTAIVIFSGKWLEICSYYSCYLVLYFYLKITFLKVDRFNDNTSGLKKLSTVCYIPFSLNPTTWEATHVICHGTLSVITAHKWFICKICFVYHFIIGQVFKMVRFQVLMVVSMKMSEYLLGCCTV